MLSSEAFLHDSAAGAGDVAAGGGTIADGVEETGVDTLEEVGVATSGDGSDPVGITGGDDGTADRVLGDGSRKLSDGEDAALGDDDKPGFDKSCGIDGIARSV